MPPLIAPAITAALTTAGVSATAATLAGNVIAYTITAAATAVAGQMLADQQKPKSDPQQVTVKQALPVRTRSYGRRKLGGAFFFLETKNGSLYQSIVHGEGPWDAIEQYWLNDKNAHVVGNTVGAPPWTPNIFVSSALGTPTQAASTVLINNFPGVWTANHRLRGLAYTTMVLLAVNQEAFSKIYPNGAPALRVVARTSKVFDPRNGTTVFSENLGLCIRDYLTQPRGPGIPASMIDDASFSAFATLCDQAVPLSAGGTEPRYRVGLTYDLTQEPSEVLDLLRQAGDAELYPTPAGKVGIRGGKWEAPTVTLGPEHIRSYRYEQGNDRLAAFNRLKLTFTNPEADYQPFEIDPWEDLESQATEGELDDDLPLLQVPSWTQARRLGKIHSAKRNPRHRLVLQTTFAGIIALGERCVHVTLPELNGLDEDFFIEQFMLAGDLSGCEITLASLSAAAYGWNPATEEGTPPVAPVNTSVPTAPPEPTGLTLLVDRKQPSFGNFQVKIRAEVDPQTGAPWRTIGRYRKVGTSAWTDMDADGDWRLITDILDDGATYEVQAAHTGWGGANSASVGPWTDSETIEVVADVVAAGSVADFEVAPSVSGGAVLTWINPPSISYYATEVLRVATGDPPVSVVLTAYGAAGAGMVKADFPPAGTYDWYVRTVNKSGVRSTPLGPFTETVT